MQQSARARGRCAATGLVALALACLGPTGQAAAGFGWVSGIAAASQGNLYIADKAHRRVLKLTPRGVYLTVSIKGLAGDPWALAVDSHEALYVAAPDLNAIVVVAASGAQTTIPLEKGFEPTAVATDGAGDL